MLRCMARNCRYARASGSKVQHVPEILDTGTNLGFFEVHAENYMVAGGPLLAHLGRVRERYPLSVHGVGLSIGAEAPLDAEHLDRLSALLSRFEPQSFSEHLAWSSHGGNFYNDLLPVPYDSVTLQRVCDHIDQVQQRLKRRLLLENPSTYVEYECSTMDEAQFLSEVVRALRLRPAAGCEQRLCQRDQSRARCAGLRLVDAPDRRGRNPPGRVRRRSRRGRLAPAHRHPWRGHRRRGVVALRGDAAHGRAPADADRARQQHPVTRGAVRRGATRRTCAVRMPRPGGASGMSVAGPPQDAKAPSGGSAEASASSVGVMSIAGPSLPQHVFARALLDPQQPCPPGLRSWNGSDPAARFAVHRNNAVSSLVDALADTFPVTRELVGEAFFAAMARLFVMGAPPRSPVLALYGGDFPAFVEGLRSCSSVPYLADVARLEVQRIRAFHAADAPVLTAGDLTRHLLDPQAVAASRVKFHPSAAVLTVAFRHRRVVGCAPGRGRDLPRSIRNSRKARSCCVSGTTWPSSPSPGEVPCSSGI